MVEDECRGAIRKAKDEQRRNMDRASNGFKLEIPKACEIKFQEGSSVIETVQECT